MRSLRDAAMTYFKYGQEDLETRGISLEEDEEEASENVTKTRYR